MRFVIYIFFYFVSLQGFCQGEFEESATTSINLQACPEFNLFRKIVTNIDSKKSGADNYYSIYDKNEHVLIPFRASLIQYEEESKTLKIYTLKNDTIQDFIVRNKTFQKFNKSLRYIIFERDSITNLLDNSTDEVIPNLKDVGIFQNWIFCRNLTNSFLLNILTKEKKEIGNDFNIFSCEKEDVNKAYFIVYKNFKNNVLYGLIDDNGKFISNPNFFSKMTRFSSKLYCIDSSSVSFIDFYENEIKIVKHQNIHEIYIPDLSETIFFIQKIDNFYYYLDESFNKITEQKFKYISDSGYPIVVQNESGKFGALNFTADILIPFEYDKFIPRTDAELEFQMTRLKKGSIIDTFDDEGKKIVKKK